MERSRPAAMQCPAPGAVHRNGVAPRSGGDGTADAIGLAPAVDCAAMSQLCSRVLAEIQTRIVAHLGALPRGSRPTLLDVGCWDGASTARYGEALGGARLLGVEVFEDQAREAEKLGIEVARVDLE